MSSTYEKEQKDIIVTISNAEHDISNAEHENVDLKVFLKEIRKCTDVKKLTPTIVNTLIKKIYVHNVEKNDGHKKVKIGIEFIATGRISIPADRELIELMNELKTGKIKEA